MLKKFVYVTGLLDYLVGIGTAAPAFLAPDPERVASTVPLGAFLCFAAASLVWASHDLAERGCVVVWQGLVRLTAVASVIAAMQVGMVDSLVTLYQMDAAAAKGMLYSMIAFDTTVATVYIVGLSRSPGHSFGGLLLGRPASSAA